MVTVIELLDASVTYLISLTVGISLLIQSTAAVAVPSFPALSTNLNVNVPFSLNV